MHCKVCSEIAVFFAKETIIDKHSIHYYRCEACGFIQTEEPYWLEDAYSKAITESDVGLVNRNLKLAIQSQAVISTWFNPEKQFLDFAGGYGLLVRLMRDAGYDFRWYDKYCNNIFAIGFEAHIYGQSDFELVTAFEVFEHMSNPLAQIEVIGHYSRNILFSTEIIPQAAPQPDKWWYYGLDHGQHISFFTLKSLEVIADRMSLNLYTNGTSLHLFTDKKLSPFLFRISTRSILSKLLCSVFQRKTLLMDDHADILRIIGR